VLPAAALTFSEPVNGEKISITLAGPAHYRQDH
jgi:hypothetical protein